MQASSSSGPEQMPSMGCSTSLSITSINPEPITKKGILRTNRRISCIYYTKKKEGLTLPVFVAVEEKTGGTALGTVYGRLSFKRVSSQPGQELTESQLTLLSRYLGKVALGRSVFVNDHRTYKTLQLSEMYFETILEKLAYDLYEELGRGLLQVPKTFLSRQPILDRFTINHPVALSLAGTPLECARAGFPDIYREPHERLPNESLRIMCRYVKGYDNFTNAMTRNLDGTEISFMEFVRSNHKPPTGLLTPEPEKRLVPLRGFIALLGIGRVLGDTDLLGGKGDNAGFVWVRDDAGQIISAETVKIDPGMAFSFKDDVNWAYKQWECCNKSDPDELVAVKAVVRNIQTANVTDETTLIVWENLSLEQKEEFLQILFNSSRYLSAPGVLELLFFRDGMFNRSDIEQIPREKAIQYKDEMVNWLKAQLDIYGDELLQFKQRFPSRVIRAHYIDRWGELPIPASDETFPIRELFTQLTIVETGKKKTQAELAVAVSDPELPERDSLFESFQQMEMSDQALPIENFFDSVVTGTFCRKVLLLGRAGIGKSTICQKIAHDWASGRLWNDRFQHVYWLPLRELNALIEEGGAIHGKEGDEWLAEAVGHLILNDPRLISDVLRQIQREKQAILVILDGYDEATPQLARAISFLLDDPNLTLFITSRPGVTHHLHPRMDRLVENIGFSKNHIERYLDRFFYRKENPTPELTARRDAFLEILKGDANLFAVSHIPLQLQMLAILWEEGGERVGFPRTLTGIYAEMVDWLFKWQVRRSGHNPYSFSGLYRNELFSVLGEVGLASLEKGKLVIPKDVMDPILGQSRFSEKELLDTGLIRAAGEGMTREYCFLHLTFQEYMIACAVHGKPEAEKNAWIIKYRYKPQFQLVIAFLAGMTHISGGNDLQKIKSFFEVLHTPPGDLIGLFQLELTLRCLNECLSPELQEWLEERFHIYDALSETLSKSINEGKKGAWIVLQTVFRYSRGCDQTIRKLIDNLIGSLKNSDEDVVYTSILMLGDFIEAKAIGDPGNVITSLSISNCLKHPSSTVRFSAAKVLTMCIRTLPPTHLPEVVFCFNLALRDQDSNVRKHIAMGLAASIPKLNVDDLERIVTPLESLHHLLGIHDFTSFEILLEQLPQYLTPLAGTILGLFGEPTFARYKFEGLFAILKKNSDKIPPDFLPQFIEPVIQNGQFSSHAAEFLVQIISGMPKADSSALVDNLIMRLNEGDWKRRLMRSGILMAYHQTLSHEEAETDRIITRIAASFIDQGREISGVEADLLVKGVDKLIEDGQNVAPIIDTLILILSQKRTESREYWRIAEEALVKLANGPHCEQANLQLVHQFSHLIMNESLSSLLEKISVSADHPLLDLIYEALSDENALVRKEARRSLLTIIKKKRPEEALHLLIRYRPIWHQQIRYLMTPQIVSQEDGLPPVSSAVSSTESEQRRASPIVVSTSRKFEIEGQDSLFALVAKTFPDDLRLCIEIIHGLLNTNAPRDFRAALEIFNSISCCFSPEHAESIVRLSDLIRNFALHRDLPKEFHWIRFAHHIKSFFVHNVSAVSPTLVEMFLDARFRNTFCEEEDTTIFDCVPLRVYLECNDHSTGKKFSVLVNQLIKRKSSLHLYEGGEEPVGCWIENNQEVSISVDDFRQLQTQALTSHLLRKYVMSYQARTEVRDLGPLLQWLTQRLGGGWEVSLSINGEQVQIIREDQNLDLLRRARTALIDFSDGVTSRLDANHGRILIQGNSSDIAQFLDSIA